MGRSISGSGAVRARLQSRLLKRLQRPQHGAQPSHYNSFCITGYAGAMQVGEEAMHRHSGSSTSSCRREQSKRGLVVKREAQEKLELPIKDLRGYIRRETITHYLRNGECPSLLLMKLLPRSLLQVQCCCYRQMSLGDKTHRSITKEPPSCSVNKSRHQQVDDKGTSLHHRQEALLRQLSS